FHKGFIGGHVTSDGVPLGSDVGSSTRMLLSLTPVLGLLALEVRDQLGLEDVVLRLLSHDLAATGSVGVLLASLARPPARLTVLEDEVHVARIERQRDLALAGGALQGLHAHLHALVVDEREADLCGISAAFTTSRVGRHVTFLLIWIWTRLHPS